MKKILLLSLFFISFIGTSQVTIKQTKDDNDLKLSALPYYSYGKGLGLTSPDSIFQLNIRFRMQNRVTYLENDGENAAYDGQIRRLRLRFDGYVGNPKFLYAIQLSFAPGDVGEIREGENINMYTEYGEILPLLVTEHVDTPEIIPALINVQEEGPINILATNATTSFGREYGPFQKTNKVLIEVLGVISAGTAAASFKINHPVLGIISGITGIAGYVGDKLYKTFYINYWQSYATNNSTYVKQRENYFQYNNYTGFVKSRTWYFYLSQPI